MAYDKKKIFRDTVKIIEKNNLFFVEDVVAFLPIVKATFYDYFPIDSDEMNTIKEAMEKNKIITKSSIRAKLHKSGKAAELLSLYRMIATEEERRAISLQQIEAKVTTDQPRSYTIVVASGEEPKEG